MRTTWRRRDDADNPAWPGLVDIFAFTLIFVMLIWLGSDLPKKLANSKAENQNLDAQVQRLNRQNISLQTTNQNLRATVQQLTASNQDLAVKTNQLAASNLDLEAANKTLAAGNQALNSQISQLGDENAWLKDIGRRDFEALLKLLQARMAGMQMAIIPNQRDKEIEIQGRPKITFATLSYDLTPADQDRLQRLAPVLADLRREKKFFVTINGTADPREVHSLLPPRSNTELSALRAATVAAVLENAAPGLGQYLRVVGLGVKGPKNTPAGENNPDAVYRQYRTVSLVIKMDLAAIVQDSQPNQAR